MDKLIFKLFGFIVTHKSFQGKLLSVPIYTRQQSLRVERERSRTHLHVSELVVKRAKANFRIRLNSLTRISGTLLARYKMGFGLFIFALVVLSGCTQKITGKVIEQIPSETARSPEIYFCPKEDCGKVFETQIKSANSSVYCAFYAINLKNVIGSLAMKSKSIDVRLVIDSSNYKGQIKGDGVRQDNDNQLMHNKFCVIDNYIVITGSFNPTENDNYYNNNNILVVYSRNMAKNYEDEFNELWNRKFGKGSNVKYPVLYINDIETENRFCPEDCQLELSSSISKDSGLYKIINLIRMTKIY